MSEHNKWMMNRAGLFNFWYYNDEEIFEFIDGKLLLRGSNGSGKSVTMQSILPILLDGRRSPNRLDPFGSRARKIEDYLLGEKEISNRDERTGYLFLEYKRANTEQYITTGIGLQARRSKSLNFWGFIITDNRRIGKDLFLYEHEYHAGEKQKIPLSRVKLENRIGTGGHVVRTSGEYKKLVNQYIFGFKTLEAYDDLIKLLIQLRSPKLSKDFRPTVIYEILEAALPALTDDDLRHLSDTIEHMDQTKQQIEQLEREQEALDHLLKSYHAYNEHRLVETAEEYLKAKRKFVQEEKLVKEKQQEFDHLTRELANLKKKRSQLNIEAELLERQEKRLQQHKVWQLEEELTAEKNRLKDIIKDIKRKDEQLTYKTKQEIRLKEDIEQIEEKILLLQKDINHQLIDLAEVAEVTSFRRHQLNEADFKRHEQIDFDFSLWKDETRKFDKRLANICEQLRDYEQVKEKIAETDREIAHLQQLIDENRLIKQDWHNIFEQDKQDKITEIHRWVEKHPFIPIPTTLLQQMSRDLLTLYEPVSYNDIYQPFFQATYQYEQQMNKKIAIKKADLDSIKKQIVEEEELLAEWKAIRDPAPPHQREATKLAREKLQEKSYKFLPFYEAVEFQDHVGEEVQKNIEAALMDAGLLDALMTEENIPLRHDKILRAEPQMLAHTLADYLQPDLEASKHIDPVYIDEVLRSILVVADDDVEPLSIGVDGTYKVGLVEGHAVPIEQVRFIGKNARKRYRKQQIERIQEEIATLEKERHHIERDIQSLQEDLVIAEKFRAQFPNDADLQTSFQELRNTRLEIERLEKQQTDKKALLTEISQRFQRMKHTLDRQTKDLNIEFSLTAYETAKDHIQEYERSLSQLETLHLKYRHEQQNKQQRKGRLEEIEFEVDELKGELNISEDRKVRLEGNIVEIEKQLALEGVEEIRKQTREVQTKIVKTKRQLHDLSEKIPRRETEKEYLQEEISDQKQKSHFAKLLIDLWQASFKQEVSFNFVPIEEDTTDLNNLAKRLVKQFKHLSNDLPRVERRLTNVFHEQQQQLIEYRMTEDVTDIPTLSLEQETWKEEQNIILEDWKKRAVRRLIHLDFDGQRVSPYYVKQRLEEDTLRQQMSLNEQDRQLYEEILFDSVGNKLRSRISRAKQWTEQMSKLMQETVSTSGISFSIRWRPRTAETEAELDTKELIDLLQRDPRLLKDEDLNQIIEHFRSKINQAKELAEIKGEGTTLLQILKEVLDYRYWFSFVLSYQRINEPRRELTNNAFDKLSGGEKAMAMYIPLFTASYSRYLEAAPTAPYIISLDEAFAGVDDDNISALFHIIEELGFNYMMNSQVLWGDYDTVSSLSICELVRPKNADFVSVIRYIWDGRTRHLVVDDIAGSDKAKKELIATSPSSGE